MLMGLVAAQAQQRSIVNPGFESFASGYTPPATTFEITSDSNILGWNSTDGTIEVWRSGFLGVAASAGDYFVELNPRRPVGLYQDVCLINGETLSWSWDHRARESGPTDQVATYSVVSQTGTEIQLLATDTASRTGNQATTLWQNVAGSTTYTGPTGIQRLEFRSLNNGAAGNFLDNIQVQLVPVVGFVPTNRRVPETAGDNVPMLVVSGQVTETVTATVGVTGGTATQGVDFNLTSPTITIPAGNYDGTVANAGFPVPITVIPDRLVEGDETVQLELVSTLPAGALPIGDPACASTNANTFTLTIFDQFDFSDAPLTGTAYGSAFHGVGAPIYLGAGVTVDAAAFDSATASGDVDDGISAFPELSEGATSYSIPAGNITALGTGTLHAWIDFDQNNAFDASEHTTVSVTNGVVSGPLAWSGISAVAGPTFARFRFTSDNLVSATTPSGVASNGEVEDYPVTVEVPSIAATKTDTVTTAGGRLATVTDAGDTVSYQFAITNTSNLTLTNVGIASDTLTRNGGGTLSLTTGPTFVSNSGGSAAGTLVPGEVATFTATYVLVQADIEAGGVTNSAVATATPPNAPPVTDTSDDPADGTNTVPAGDTSPGDPTVTTIAPFAQLDVSKGASVGTLNPDGTVDVTYTVVVENSGSVTLGTLALVDDLTATGQLGGAFNGVVAAPVVSAVTISAGSTLPTSNGGAYDGTNGLTLGSDGNLLPGDSYQVVFTVNVDPNAPSASSPLQNTATASGTPLAAGSAPVTDQSDTDTSPAGGADGTANVPGGPGAPTIITPPAALPELTTTKVPDITSNARIGDTITYTYTVANTGNVTVSGVTVADNHTSSSGTAALTVSDETAASVANGSVDAGVDGSWDSLFPGDSITFTSTYTVTGYDIVAGSNITNTATASGTPPAGILVSDPASASVSVAPLVPRAPLGNTLNTCGDFRYEGFRTIGSTLTDRLQTFSGGPEDPYSYVAMTRNPSTGVVTAYYEGAPDASGSGNDTSFTTGPFVDNNFQTTNQNQAGHQSELTMVAYRFEGEPGAAESITLQTQGAQEHTAYWVQNLAGNTLTSSDFLATWSGTGANQVGNDLPLSFTYPADGVVIVNVAIFDATRAHGLYDFAPGYTCPVAELDVAKSASVGPFNPDGSFDVTYAINVTNSGSLILNGITLVDDLTAADQLGGAYAGTVLSPVVTGAAAAGSSAPSGNAAYDGVGSLIGTGGRLAVGDTMTVTFTVTVDPLDPGAASPLDNTATATGTPLATGAAPVSDASDTDTQADGSPDVVPNVPGEGTGVPTEVLPPAGTGVIGLLKSGELATDVVGDPGVANVGDQITYTYTVTNTGPLNVLDVAVTEPNAAPNVFSGTGTPPVPSGETLVGSGSGNSTDTAPNDGIWSVLAPGDSVTYSAVYTLTQADISAGKVDNSALANGTDPFGNALADTSDENAGGGGSNDPGEDDPTSVPITAVTGLSMVKTIVEPTPTVFSDAAPDNVLNYTYEVINTGNVTIPSTDTLTIVDNLIDTAAITCPAIPAAGLPPIDPDGDGTPDAIVDGTNQLTCTASYTITADDLALGSVNNVARANTATTGNSPPDDAIFPADATPALGVAKTATAGQNFTAVGDLVTYQYVVTNTGGGAYVEPITLTDDKDLVVVTTVNGAPANTAVPAGTPFTCWSPTAGTDPSFTPDGGFPTTTNGEQAICTATYAVTQADLDAGQVVNTVVAETEYPAAGGTPVSSAPASQTVLAGRTPAIEVVKSATVGALQADGSFDVTFTFVTTNTGNVTLSRLSLVDDLNTQYGAGVVQSIVTQPRVTSAPTLPGSVNPGGPTVSYLGGATPLIGTGGALAVGDSYTVTFVANLKAVTALENTATAGGTPPTPVGGPVPAPITDNSQNGASTVDDGDPLTGETSDGTDPNGADGDTEIPTVITPPSAAASIALVKTSTVDTSGGANATSLDAGDTIDYVYTVTNTSPTLNALNVVVSETGATFTGSGTVPVPATDNNGTTVDATATRNDLAPNATLTWSASYVLTQADIDQGSVVNQATVAAQDPFGNDLSDNSDDNSVAEDDPTTTPLARTPELTVAKSSGAQSALSVDGTFTQQFSIDLENTGNTTITGPTLVDDLEATFGPAFDSATGITVSPALSAVAGAPGVTANAGFDGDATDGLISGGSMQPGDTLTVTFTARFDAFQTPDPAVNTVVGGGTPPAGATLVVQGADENAAPTTDGTAASSFSPPAAMPQIGVSKAAGTPTLNANGTFDVPYTLILQNTGDVTLTDVALGDDLATQFGAAFSPSDAATATGGIIIAPAVTASSNTSGLLSVPTANGSYDGSAATGLFDATPSTLGVGDTVTVTFTARIDPNASGTFNAGPYNNTATAGGNDPSGATTTDASDNGSDPTTNPGEGTGSATPVFPPATGPELTTLKEFGATTANADGTFTVPVTITVTNTGNVDVDELQIVDDLSLPANFGTAFQSVSVAPVISVTDDGNATTALAPSANGVVFDGSTQPAILSGTDGVLGTGDILTATFTVLVDPNAASAPTVLNNVATASGTDPSGTPTTDDSGGAGGGAGVPVVLAPPATAPELTTLKEFGATTANADGTFTVPVTITVTNTGNVDVDELQIVDDLSLPANFGTAFQSVSVAPVISVTDDGNTTTALAPTANGVAFDGSAQPAILSGTDGVLGTGDILTATFTVLVDPNAASAPTVLNNVATASGTDPSGTPTTDDSGGAGGGAGVPVVLTPPATAPELTTLKEFGATTANADGTFTVPVTITVTNTGNVDVDELQIVDDLSLPANFGTAFQSVSVAPVISVTDDGNATTAVAPTANGVAFDGSAQPAILSGTDGVLGTGDILTAIFTVLVDPNAASAPTVLNNVATASGTDPSGTPTTDDSGGAGGGAGVPVVLTPPATAPELTTLKEFGATTANADGTFTVPVTITVTNTGNVDVDELQIVDDLSLPANFGTAFQSVTVAPVISVTDDGNTTTALAPTANGVAFDGSTQPAILSGTDGVLGTGDILTATFTVLVDPNAASAPTVLNNVATASGTDPSGTPTTDDSGGAGGGAGVPVVLIAPAGSPEVGVSKAVGTPVLNSDNTFDVTYTIALENTGDVTLNNIQLSDDFSTQFGPNFTASNESVGTSGVTSGPVVTSSAGAPVLPTALTGSYDGTGNLFSGSDGVLNPGDRITVVLTVRIDPNAGGSYRSGPYSNIANGSGSSPSGAVATDASDNGSDPTNNSGETVGTATIVTLPDRLVGLTVRKAANVSTARIGDVVTYTITVRNDDTLDRLGVDLVDVLPAGLTYRPNSAKIEDVAVEPVIAGRKLTWPGQDIAASSSIRLTLSVGLSAAATFDEFINQAWVVDPLTGGIISNKAQAIIRREIEHVFDCGEIIGKVFDDKNRNGVQDEDLGEPGLPGVRLATVRGLLITTDQYGRFNVPCADVPDAEIGSNFILKLDPRTLPSGYRVTTENPRVVRLTRGKLTKLNFGASIGRVVQIQLTDTAFLAGSGEPSKALLDGLQTLAAQLDADDGSVLKITYRDKGEGRAISNARLKRVKQLIARSMKRFRDRDIETRVVRGK